MENYSDIKKCLEELLKEKKSVSNGTSGQVNQDDHHLKVELGEKVVQGNRENPAILHHVLEAKKEKSMERLNIVEKLIQTKEACIEEIKKRSDDAITSKGHTQDLYDGDFDQLLRLREALHFILVTVSPEQFQQAEESVKQQLRDEVENMQQRFNTVTGGMHQNKAELERINKLIEQFKKDEATEIEELNMLRGERDQLIKDLKEIEDTAFIHMDGKLEKQ